MATIVSEFTAAPLVVTLFGPIQVSVEGKPLSRLRSRKAVWLLALLALRAGRPVEREWLAGTLWPDSDQEQALDNMRPVLSELRRALGTQEERLKSPNRNTLCLELEGTDIDVAAFDAAIASKKLPALERAVALYTGPLLEGCPEEWATQERQVREQDCLRALQTLGEAALEAGDYGTASGYFQRAVALDPWRDASRRGLMEALAKTGDTNAALQVYRDFTELLRTDPKAVPDPETSALYARLRAEAHRPAAMPALAMAEESPAPVVTGYLPHALTDLVGREDERLEVAAQLRRSRLVTLTGPGGIGKTRLAIEVAREVVREYADGVWLVALDSLSDGKGIVPQIAAVIGLKEEPGRTFRETLTDYFRTKRLLLVLDNCEHIITASAQITAHLLEHCAGLRILATSREVLGITGETAWAVPSLSVPDSTQLPPTLDTLPRVLIGYESVQLFVERTLAVQKAFTLTSDEAHEVALLCSRLEGVPLALELAAARMGVLTPAQILMQLAARPLDALASRGRDIAPRHRTLRATLEWSYGLLPPDAQAFLADLGVFRGGWTLQAAQAVCPAVDAVEMLSVLRDASLVAAPGDTYSSDAADERFLILETVRQFAAETLEKSGRAEEVGRRHAWYYALYMEKIAYDTNRFFINLEFEYANVRAALAWALEAGEQDLLGSICRYLPSFCVLTSRATEGRDWMEKVAQTFTWEATDNSKRRSDLTNPQGTPDVHLSLSHESFLLGQVSILFALGEFEAAAESSFRIFESNQRTGNPVDGRTHLYHAGTFLMYSDLVRSLAILEQCLPLERAYSPDGRGNPIILSQLADVTRLVGQPERAAAFLAEALELCRGQDESDLRGYSFTLRIASQAALAEGNLVRARECFETVLAIIRPLTDTVMEATALWGLAVLAREAGDWEQAEALLTQAIVAAGPEPIFRIKYLLHHQRAEILLGAGDSMRAAGLARETLILLRGKARSCRLFVYPPLLLLIDAEVSIDLDEHGLERAARLLGAAGGVAVRLGLRTPERAERERAARLRAALTQHLEPKRLAYEEAVGAALDDEAVLEFALMAG